MFSPLPPQTAVPQNMAHQIDMGDAQAQDAIKKAIELDAFAAREMEVAQKLNEQIAAAAPGTAPILDAEASAWVVQANAYTQMGMAELLRLNSAGLSNHSGELKDSTTQMQNLNQRMIQSCRSSLIGGAVMRPGIFEFQSMLTSVVNSISGTLLSTEQNVVLCAHDHLPCAWNLRGLYQGRRCAIARWTLSSNMQSRRFVIGYWSSFFSDLFSGFNQIASSIDSSYGGVDLQRTGQTADCKPLFKTNGYDKHVHFDSVDSICAADPVRDRACVRNLSDLQFRSSLSYIHSGVRACLLWDRS